MLLSVLHSTRARRCRRGAGKLSRKLKQPHDLVWWRYRSSSRHCLSAHLSPLAMCRLYGLWHRGGVTLNRDEAATRAVASSTRLRDVRCPRNRCPRGRIVRYHSNENGLVRVPRRGVLRRMQDADVPHKWLYEPDEVPKRKHHWDQDEAGFVAVGAIFVGK